MYLNRFIPVVTPGGTFITWVLSTPLPRLCIRLIPVSYGTLLEGPGDSRATFKVQVIEAYLHEFAVSQYASWRAYVTGRPADFTEVASVLYRPNQTSESLGYGSKYLIQ